MADALAYQRREPETTVLYRAVQQNLETFLATAQDQGAVSFLQRLGSALNLNLHFHTLVLDGTYTGIRDPDPPTRFLPLPRDRPRAAPNRRPAAGATPTP
jgi:hypothetical protein